jgi:hypothetical protein
MQNRTEARLVVEENPKPDSKNGREKQGARASARATPNGENWWKGKIGAWAENEDQAGVAKIDSGDKNLYAKNWEPPDLVDKRKIKDRRTQSSTGSAKEELKRKQFFIEIQ